MFSNHILKNGHPRLNQINMTESLIQFRNRLTRKAFQNFGENQNVTLKEFIDFVNYKIGTEMQEQFITECYEYFLKECEALKNAPSPEI